MEDTMLKAIKKYFNQFNPFFQAQAAVFYERKWHEECVAHAKTKLLLAEQTAEFKTGNTLHTWPEDDALQEDIAWAKQELYEAEEDLRRIS
jgi:hypothetical protein